MVEPPRRETGFGPFRVTWALPELDEVFAALLGHTAASQQVDAELRVDAVLVDRVPPPFSADEAFFLGDVRCALVDGGMHMHDGYTVADVAADGRRVRVALHPASLQSGAPFRTHGAPGMLAVAARARDVFHMHAAVTSLDGAPVVVVGQGHAGKTTTALSLLDAGGHWAGDDLALFRQTPDGVDVWGVPRVFHLRPRTAAAFPKLAALGTPHPSGRVDLDLAACLPERRFAGAVRPKLVVIPQVSDRANTVAAVTDHADALGHLLHASAMIVANELGRQRDQLQVLAALAADATPITLALGRDALDDPGRVPAAIRAALNGA